MSSNTTRTQGEALTRPDGTPIRILAVDDEQSLTELLSMAMRYEGWDVTTAGSGLSAVQAARVHLLDLAALAAVPRQGNQAFRVAADGQSLGAGGLNALMLEELVYQRLAQPNALVFSST